MHSNVLAASPAIVVAIVFGRCVQADVLHVPADYATIQQAIDAAAMNGDEIVVAPGTYPEALDLLGKAVWLHSSDGPEVTVIDLPWVQNTILCTRKEGPDTVLDGFTITGAEMSGAMIIRDSSPTIVNCVFSGNQSWWGPGGVYLERSRAIIASCTFTGNEVVISTAGALQAFLSSPAIIDCDFVSNRGYNSGAVELIASSARVDRCRFADNSAQGAGAFGCFLSDAVIVDCEFEGNFSEVAGGAVVVSNSQAVITDCTFSRNAAGSIGEGGAIHASLALLQVDRCRFFDNSAPWGGGAILSGELATSQITNSLFVGNAGACGAAICTYYGTAYILNCTITGNVSSWIGGGAANYAGHMVIRNSIIRGNNQGDVEWADGPPPDVAFSNVPKFTRSGVGNFNLDPLYVDPANGDYRLQPGSPCVDAGLSAAVPMDILVDILGQPRFVQGRRAPHSNDEIMPPVDMGAYEFQVK